MGFYCYIYQQVQADVLGDCSITTPLFFGSNSSDVLKLQKILNKDPDTAIQGNGAGSKGRETTYFGQLTKQAVMSFQQKYSSDILVPAGINMPSGYVGAFSLNKLAYVCQNHDDTAISQMSATNIIDIYETDRKIQLVQAQANSAVNQSFISHTVPQLDFSSFTTQIGSLLISGLSINSGLPGTKVYINGQGFEKTNIVYIGNENVTYPIDSKVSGSYVYFTVPSIPQGRYDVAVKNSKGVSNTIFFIVKGEIEVAPVINRIEPSSVRYGQAITIYGKGFTPAGNEVYTNFGTEKGVISPDGTSLTITIKPASMEAASSAGNGNKEFYVQVGVINSNGYTTTPAMFIFQI